MLIKCGDVSNPTKDFDIYSKWTGFVLEEWQTQGDMEKKMFLPVSAFMDRDNPNVLLSSQCGFIDFIIIPMYETVHQGFIQIPDIMEGIERNRNHWLKIKEAKEAKEKEQTAAEACTPSPRPTPTLIAAARRWSTSSRTSNTRENPVLRMPSPIQSVNDVSKTATISRSSSRN
jgi:hypothetical protein